MKTFTMASSSISQKPIDEPHIETTESAWKPLYRVGAVAALIIVVFIELTRRTPLVLTLLRTRLEHL